MPHQHKGKEGHKISSITIIHAEIWETRRIGGRLHHRLRSSSQITGMGGHTQTRDFTADRQAICRVSKTKSGILRWAPGAP